jgi:probable F420-dependent oxidoreductase
MKFGIHLPNFSPLNGREPTIRIARRAEELGFDSLWVSDHVILPAAIASRYPYSRTGVFPTDTTANIIDPFIALAVAAGCTERVELGITVLVLPLRNPLLTAKMLASLDMLAGGRVILATGAGWLREEFEALNAPPFADRGRVTDEWIRIFRTCWEQPLPSFEGRYYRFAPVHFAPRPTRRIPIWVGGHSEPALRRAGRLGDGWQPARMHIDEIGAAIAGVREHARAAGRDPDALTFSLGCVLDVRDGANAGTPAPSRDLIGTPAQIVQFIHRLEALGITHLALDFRAGSSLEGMLQTMDRFHERVRPSL